MKSTPSLPTAAVGVDVGSWNCCVATVRRKVVDAVEDEYGNRKIPNFVLFDSSMQYSGSDAKANQDINFENTIFDYMQFLRKPYSKASALSLQYPYKIVSGVGGNAHIAIEFGAKSYNLLPEQLLAMVLRKLKSVADDASGESVNNFVINVPEFYDEEQRAAIYDAAEIAGINCLELLEDTYAVAINYAHSSRQVPERSDQFVTVAFVIVGYSCTQIAVCKINKRRIVVCAHSSDPCLGGRDFDNAIYNHLVANHPFLMEVDAVTRIRVLRECEEAKKRMGLHKKPVTITVDSLPGERSVNVKMDRQMFEKASEQLLKRFENTLRKSVSNSMFDVEVVELVGGGVRIPAIKDSVQKVFGIAGQMTMNGDEALASGCALRAAAIQSPDDSSECKIVILKETEEHKLSIDDRVFKEYQTEYRCLEQGCRAHQHQQQQQQQQQLQRHPQPIELQSNANNASRQLVSAMEVNPLCETLILAKCQSTIQPRERVIQANLVNDNNYPVGGSSYNDPQRLKDFMERLQSVQKEAKSSLESLSGDSSGYLQTNEFLGHYLKFTQLLSELITNTPYSQISQGQLVQPATWNTLVKLQKNLRIEVVCALMYLISKTNPDLRIPINEEKYILDEGSKLVRLLAECTNEVKALPKRTDRSFEGDEVLRSLDGARNWLCSTEGQYGYWVERYIRSSYLKRANSTLWSFVENLQPHYTSEVSSQRISGLSISLSTKVDEYAHQYLRLLHQWCHVRIELNRTLQEYFTSLRMSTEEILNALTQEPKNPIKGGRAQELSRSSYTTDF